MRNINSISQAINLIFLIISQSLVTKEKLDRNKEFK